MVAAIAARLRAGARSGASLDRAGLVRGLARLAPHLPLVALVVAYGVRFSLLSVAVHDGFGTPPYDMALFDQGIWLLSRFHAPFVTVMGRNLFGDHTCFILLLVVPLFWVYPHAQALLVLQAWVLAAAAIPIYLLGRRLLGRDALGTALATAMAATYLLNPALQNGNLEQFHPECFLVLALSLGLYAAIDWHPRLLVVAAVAALMCKQDSALLVIPLGLWIAWRRDRRLGFAIAAGSAAWMAVAFLVIINLILGTASFNMARVPFGGIGGFVSAMFTKPRQVWDYVTSQGRLFYLWQMGFSVGWAFTLAPSVAAVAILTFLENELANFGYMHEIQYHYSMPLVPILVVGTMYAVSRLRTAPGARRRPDGEGGAPARAAAADGTATAPVIAVAADPVDRRLQAGVTGLVAGCALVACVFWGLAPFSMNDYPHQSTASPAVRDANAVIAHLPPSAVVSAWYPYVSHIDHRTRVYMWPTPFSAKFWGLYHQEGQRLPFAGQITYVLLPTDLTGDDAAVFAGISSQYRVVYRVGDTTLYEKKAPPG